MRNTSSTQDVSCVMKQGQTTKQLNSVWRRILQTEGLWLSISLQTAGAKEKT